MTVTRIDIRRPFPKESELYDRIEKLCHEYDDQISVVAVMGILDLIKMELAQQEDQ